MSITRRIIIRLKETLFKKPRIAWDNKDEDQILWKIPNEIYPDINKIGEIEVKQGERVAMFEGGVFKVIFPPGVNRLVDNYDSAYFVDVTPKKNQIGIRAPNYPITKDNKSFGFSGNIIFRVMEDPSSIGNFLTKVVSNEDMVTVRSVSLWLRDGLLFQVFKELISGYEYEEFRGLEKIELDMNLETKLGYELKNYGLEVESFEIRYYTPPNAFK